jgi:CDP-2,3-bis-(O-geranylgeranyl)-sn-glycerol synthase
MLMEVIYQIIIYPILYILPAYIANGSPVIFGGGPPLDFGKRLFGKRILGDNKTIRGTVMGILCGAAVGVFEYPAFPYMIPIAIALSIGTIAGDSAGSFIKRRLNIKPGSSIPLMDQYGFYIFALLFAYPFGHMPGLYGLIFITVLTGIIHYATNVGAHRLRLKKVPW